MVLILALAAAAGLCVLAFNGFARRNPEATERFVASANQQVSVLGSWVTLAANVMDALQAVRRVLPGADGTRRRGGLGLRPAELLD